MSSSFYYILFLLLFSKIITLTFLIQSCLCIKSKSLESFPNIHVVNKRSHSLDVQRAFDLPAPLPKWPNGTGFATGSIDLGDITISEVTKFNKVWATYEGGQQNLGATFFEPVEIPNEYYPLGFYAQPNNRPLYGRVLVAKDTSDGSSPSLKLPLDYALVWSSKSLGVKADSEAYIWAPIPADGYEAAGLVVTTSAQKPPVEKVRCIRSDLTTRCATDEWIWGREADDNSNALFNIFEARPARRGKNAPGVSMGTFMARSGGGTTNDMPLLACLKNNNKSFPYMPTREQVDAIMQHYSPRVYCHPEETFLPSSVQWFFSNGALFYKKGQESNPQPMDPTGANLPQGGANDHQYWIDLPRDKKEMNRVKRGDIGSAMAYVHLKPTFGGTYIDIAIWLFYPFNGPSKAKIGFVSIPLGRLGEHVADWEHVTMRISNFDGRLRKVYFSQHSGGEWVYAPDLEYLEGNKFVTYSSLGGHACYPRRNHDLISDGFVGIRNDTDRSDKYWDTAKSYTIISGDYIGGVPEPHWLNYARKWGPKITYNYVDEIHKIADALPGKLKSAFLNFTKSLPPELLGENGPNGPKMKRNWDGDESK